MLPENEILHKQAESLKYEHFHFMMPIGLPIYLLFGIVDYLYRPELVPCWWTLRFLAGVSALILAWIFKFRIISSRMSIWLNLAFSLLLSNSINLMIYQSGGTQSLYLPGLLLVGIASLWIYRYGILYTVVASVGIFGPTVFILATSQAASGNDILIMTSFPITGIALAVASSIHHELSIKHGIGLQRSLQEAEVRSQAYEAIAKTSQMIAHDIRKPLSMLDGVLSLLEKHSLNETQRSIFHKYLPMVKHAQMQANAMLHDILTVGTARQNETRELELSGVLSDCLTQVFSFDHESQLTLRYQLDHTKLLLVDPLKCERVILNIVINAVKSMKNQGTITFRSRDTIYFNRQFIEISINNTGSYISDNIRSKLFDPFFTMSTKGGLGLGLTICRKFVEEHNGTISCTSSLENGTTFTLCLPASSASASSKHLPLCTSSLDFRKKLAAEGIPPEVEQCQVLMTEILNSGLMKGRRLIIQVYDDTILYNEVFFSHLNSIDPDSRMFELKFINREFLAEAEKGSFDLAFVDLDFGSTPITGIDLIASLRRSSSKGFICVHSDRGLDSFRHMIQDQRIDFFIPKPMTLDHFTQVLNSVLNSTWQATKGI